MTRENQSSGFPTRSDTNQPVHQQKMARSLKFGNWEEHELCYECGENKGADQLCSYCTADLHLCFRIDKIIWFSKDTAHILLYDKTISLSLGGFPEQQKHRFICQVCPHCPQEESQSKLSRLIRLRDADVVRCLPCANRLLSCFLLLLY